MRDPPVRYFEAGAVSTSCFPRASQCPRLEAGFQKTPIFSG